MYPEYALLSFAFNAFPALQQQRVIVPPSDTATATPPITKSSSGDENDSQDQGDTQNLLGPPPPRKSCCASATASCTLLRSGWQVYARQQVFPAALALAMLYVSTIAFGSIMTVFLNWAGIPIFILSVARGIGAVFGVLATVTFEP